MTTINRFSHIELKLEFGEGTTGQLNKWIARGWFDDEQTLATLVSNFSPEYNDRTYNKLYIYIREKATGVLLGRPRFDLRAEEDTVETVTDYMQAVDAKVGKKQ